METLLNPQEIVLDGVLALGLLVLGWTALSSRNLFKGIVLFISLGLVMSLVWVRLNAVDIALAEAAIGAGLTGALFLSALGRMQGRRGQDRSEKGGVRLGREDEPGADKEGP